MWKKMLQTIKPFVTSEEAEPEVMLLCDHVAVTVFDADL